MIGDKALEDATDILNRGIDSPLIGAEEDGRPLWRWIAKDDNYTRKYHDALDKLVTDYFESGRFEREVSDLSEMLSPYAEKDPTAFFSADEYKKGCETLKQFGMRRAQSIRRGLSFICMTDTATHPMTQPRITGTGCGIGSVRINVQIKKKLILQEG